MTAGLIFTPKYSRMSVRGLHVNTAVESWYCFACCCWIAEHVPCGLWTAQRCAYERIVPPAWGLLEAGVRGPLKKKSRFTFHKKKDWDLLFYAALIPAPRFQTGRDNSTQGVPIALALRLRRLATEWRVASPLCAVGIKRPQAEQRVGALRICFCFLVFESGVYISFRLQVYSH
jgi:hypothetical protein